VPKSYQDFTKPEYKDKLVMTYPNDDDAILYQFDIMYVHMSLILLVQVELTSSRSIQELGEEWFDALLANNPRWVRGTATPGTLIRDESNTSAAATFCGSGFSFVDKPPISFALDPKIKFVSWPQTGAILKDAPHPEGAKLLHSFMLSDEYTGNNKWSVRNDILAPTGGETIMKQNNTDPTAFAKYMADRVNVERRKFWYEARIGTAQGISPLDDDM
jgi:ABC-type Fe3+ transport system substrate-binding protein